MGLREGAELFDLLIEAARLVPQPSLRLLYLREACIVSFWVGDREVTEHTLSQLVLPAGPNANFSEVFALVPYTMSLTVSGDLEGAAIRRDELVDGLTILGAPEATVYETTTMMALARETGTLADLGLVADLTEHIGHPASAARSISVYIRLAQNDIDRVMTALELISTEELADDAGYPIVAAYWSEIVAALRITDQCRRFIVELEPMTGTQLATGGIHLGSARLTATGPSSMTRSANTTSPTSCSPQPSSSTKPSAHRRGSPAPISTGRSQSSPEAFSTTPAPTSTQPERRSVISTFPTTNVASTPSHPNSETHRQVRSNPRTLRSILAPGCSRRSHLDHGGGLVFRSRELRVRER